MFKRSTLLLLLYVFCIAASPPLRAADEAEEREVEIQQSEYYRSIPNVKPKKREVYYYEQRNYPYTRVPQNARVKALEQMDRMAAERGKSAQVLAEQPAWRSIGPFEVGGRVRSIIVHPTDPNNVYIGSAAGGAWHTTDGGQTWNPIFDNQNASAFGSLALDPNNPNVLWAATGEIEASIDAYLSNGVYKSTDGGTTWAHIGLANVGAFSKIYVHPLNSNFIVAGAVKNGAGFYKSTDGGANWQKTFNGPVSDVSISHQSQNIVYIGVTGEGVYRSTDGGNTFEFLSNGFPAFNVGRVSVQASQSDQSVLYCLIVRYEVTSETSRTELPEIYKSTNGGDSWSLIYAGEAAFFNNQGFYNHFIEVHPSDPKIAFAGGIDVFRTLDGNKWSNVTFVYSGGSVHPDQHCLAFAPSDPKTIYLGNDGGMYVSKDGGYNWTAINSGLAITQFYKMGIDQSASNTNYGGAQDNGTQGSVNNVPNWQAVGGGDGGYVTVDYGNPSYIYGSYQQGAMWKRNVKTGQTVGLPLPSQDVDAPLFIAPHIIDPQDNNILYHGRQRLYFSADGGGDWVVLPGLSGLQGSISAIAVSYAEGKYVQIIGTSRGEVRVSRDGGETWLNISENGLPQRFVTDIVPSPSDAETFYVSLAGFGTSHVFKTIDGGESWVDISKPLPDIPCGSIVLDPSNENIIFAGTDIGVFVTYDAGATWIPFGKGLPRTHVADLEFHTESRVLRAATHGRSMWEVDVPATAVEESGITSPAGGENYNAQSSQVISWYGLSGSVKVEYSVDDGAQWTTLAEAAVGNYLRWQIPDRPTITGRVRITSNTQPSTVLLSRTFAINKFSPGSVLAQSSVNHIPYGLAFDGANGLWTTSFYGNKLYKLNATTLQIESSFTIPGGDSLYTDIAIDRASQTIYVHKLTSSSTPAGGQILVMTPSGELLRTMTSPCTRYPIGLAWINGQLLASDRDTRKLFWTDPQTGSKISEDDNPFQKFYGPRGLSSDEEGNCYQASTDFSGNSLQGAYNVQFTSIDMSEVRRMDLRTNTATINARGIEFDPRDKTFWISDFEGSIYKTAGFEIETDVREEQPGAVRLLTVQNLSPNPFSDNTKIDFTIASASAVRVEVFSPSGHRVALLHDGLLQAGDHSMVLRSADLASGVYTVVFSVNNQPVASHSAILLR